MLIKCGRCGLEKEHTFFSKNKSTKNGFNCYCKECSSNIKKLYYLKNKNRIIEKSKRYYNENKEYVLERVKGYNLENKEKIQDYHKRYTEINSSKLKEQSKHYRVENREKLLKEKREYYLANRDVFLLRARKYSLENKNKLSLQKKDYTKKYNRSLCKFNNYYTEQLKLYEEVKESTGGYLMVKCSYCGVFYIPTILSAKSRLLAINGKLRGEGRFYCSDHCKKACPIFNQKFFPRGFKKATSREVQPELRQLVLARDDYTCQICGRSQQEVELHCHHIEGVIQNPVESADVDNCITLCKEHHKFVHSQKGCTYHDFKCLNNNN